MGAQQKTRHKAGFSFHGFFTVLISIAEQAQHKHEQV